MAVPDTLCQHYCSALQPPSDASGSVPCLIAKRRHDKSCLGGSQEGQNGLKGKVRQCHSGLGGMFEVLLSLVPLERQAAFTCRQWVCSVGNSCREAILLFLIKADFFTVKSLKTVSSVSALLQKD